MNVRELMDELDGLPEDAEVRLAFQPEWPLQYHVDQVIEFRDEHDVDENGLCETCGSDFSGEDDPTIAIEKHLEETDGTDSSTVYLAEGGQVYDAPYLPGAAVRELGWR